MKIKARLVQFRHWLSVRRVGLLAGLVAALVMTLILLVLRTLFGAPTPSELIADRTAPFLPLPVFFVMLGAAGGYNNLKGFEVVSTILGQLAVGALGGAVYEQLLVPKSATASRFGRLVGSVRGGLFVAGMVLAAWVLSLLLFWPLFTTNYDGRAVEAARFGSMIGLLVAYASYGIIVPFAYGFVAKRRAEEASATPVQASGRRAFVLGGIGALLALGSGALLARLYRQATFFYDGMQYLGPDIQPITPNDRFYAVTKNIVDPHVMPSQWRLAVDGLVARHRFTT
ncbi:MAG: hypothetical protein H7Z42_14900 [Roseiflexaceae bacterium]|nr:hypothetical protein [Roseiflexaceae bacterium]